MRCDKKCVACDLLAEFPMIRLAGGRVAEAQRSERDDEAEERLGGIDAIVAASSWPAAAAAAARCH